MQKEAENVGTRFTLFNNLQSGGLSSSPRLRPIRRRPGCFPPAIGDNYSQAQADEAMENMRGLASAYISGDAFHFNLRASQLRAALRGLNPADLSQRTQPEGRIFLQPPRSVPVGDAVLRRGRRCASVGQQVEEARGLRALRRAGLRRDGDAVSRGRAWRLRCIIAGRPPVTNMYESMVWVASGVLIFSLIFFVRYRTVTYLLAALPISLPAAARAARCRCAAGEHRSARAGAAQQLLAHHPRPDHHAELRRLRAGDGLRPHPPLPVPAQSA